MSISAPAPTRYVRRDSLFIESDCSACPLLHNCGGSTTTPCGCIRPADPCYDCTDDNTLCRARNDGTFRDSLRGGRSLDDVSLSQTPVSFPLFIPTRTHELGNSVHLNLRWAAVSLKNLLREKESLPGQVHPLIASNNDIREDLHVARHCQLLAILNGQDYQLEALWDMERRDLYDRLNTHGFAAITGPTFSIASEHHPDSRTPASHNVLMLMRHHRVLSEIPRLTSSVAIPNLYWRDGRERRKWAEWLNKNSSVHTVSRDFSRTKGPDNFPRELSGLIDITQRVNRPLHILLTGGVAAANAKTAITRLAEQQCTCSVITPYPIYTAVRSGCELVLRPDRPPLKKPQTRVDQRPLALHNLKAMEHYLMSVASALPLYHTTRVNNVTQTVPASCRGHSSHNSTSVV